MPEFADRAREALADKGMSMRKAAGVLHYDVSYLSRVLNGKQSPSAQLAEALDQLLGTDGELTSLVASGERLPAREAVGDPADLDVDVVFMRSVIDHLVEHDTRYGADTLTASAVQAWKAGQRKLDIGAVPESRQHEYLSTVAELAELSGWLLFDADRQEAARSALFESHVLARHAGDKPLERFALDLVAMQDIEQGRPGEALRIADDALTALRIPPRISLISHVRRGRALAMAGDRARTMEELTIIRGEVQRSVNPRDPSWTWWIDESVVLGHEGESLADLGDFTSAGEKISDALELISGRHPGGRAELYYIVTLLSVYVSAQAWRECEPILVSLPTLLKSVSSRLNRRRLRTALHAISRSPDAPRWAADLAHDVEELPQMLAA